MLRFHFRLNQMFAAASRLLAACAAAMVLVVLSGCIPDALRSLTSSKEEECLRSMRLTFADPDSAKVVANLGTRGLGYEDFFFLRYAAKNGYGAYVSNTVACGKVNGKWVEYDLSRLRSKIFEVFLDESLAALKARNAALRACTKLPRSEVDGCLAAAPPGHLPPSIPEGGILSWIGVESEKLAQRIIHESVDDIPGKYR